MQKENKRAFLEDDSLKHHPFLVPEGYFENFAGRLQRRIREEEEARVPVHRLWNSTRFRVALAAAVMMLALITYPIIRITTLNDARMSDYPEMIVMEQMDLMDEDLYLLELMENGTDVSSEEEIYLNQAIEHLALNEVELDLISE